MNLVTGFVAVQQLGKPSQKDLDNFLGFTADSFADGNPIHDSKWQKDYFIPFPKPGGLDKYVRDLLVYRTWRTIFVS